MKPGSRDRLVAAGSVAATWATIVRLHRLGELPWLRVEWSDLGSWARLTPFEDALAAGLRSAALVGAYWIALSTVAYLLARISGITLLVDLTRPLTLPAVRRVADRVVASSVALSTIASPLVGLTADRPLPEPVVASRPVTADPSSLIVRGFLPPALTAHPLPGDPPKDRPASRTDESPQSTVSEVVAEPGDHLWLIADRRLAAVLGRRPSDHEVAPYWAKVVAANRDHLRSGDPDLIYPGEVIALPEPDRPASP